MVKYNIKEINNLIDSLGIPKEFRNRIVNLERFFNHDITMQLSIRQDAGKTTSGLILGLCLWKLYGTTTMYMRSDNDQITQQKIVNLYNVVVEHDYVSKATKNEYNDVKYYPMLHAFFLIRKRYDDDGNVVIDKESEKPFCNVVSLENSQDYKSGMNVPHGDFIFFDECMDTKRATYRQMIELQDNISTFGRLRESCHVLMTGNNTNEFSFWFDEFCITEQIKFLKFGGYIENNTELGTTFSCELLELSDEHKEKMQTKRIRFSGFNTPKMNSFNGLSEWTGTNHNHIPDNEMLSEIPIYDRFYIKHRNVYIKIMLFSNDFGLYAFLNFSRKPLYDDNIILTCEPTKYELFGWGDSAINEEVKSYCKGFYQLLKTNRVYFNSNSVGELFDDYANTIKFFK